MKNNNKSDHQRGKTKKFMSRHIFNLPKTKNKASQKRSITYRIRIQMTEPSHQKPKKQRNGTF